MKGRKSDANLRQFVQFGRIVPVGIVPVIFSSDRTEKGKHFVKTFSVILMNRKVVVNPKMTFTSWISDICD
jgi:hypothetical protein